MLQAGWRFIEDGGPSSTALYVLPPTDGAVFFVFDVYAIDWKVVLEELVKWLGLIGCFGHAAYTTATWQSAAPLPELEVLRQFSGMSTGQTVVDTLDLAAGLSGSSSQSSSKFSGMRTGQTTLPSP
jgi:hypothetical protein